MPAPAGLHIGSDDGVIYTWNGTVVANTLNFDVAVAPAAGKHVYCLMEGESLWAGLFSTAQVWNAGTGVVHLDLGAPGIHTITSMTSVDVYGFCSATCDPTGVLAYDSVIGKWELDGTGTPAAVATFSDFAPSCVKGVRKVALVAGGFKTGALPSVRVSFDYGVTWLDTKFPDTTGGPIVDLFEFGDYVYAVYLKGTPPTSMEIWKTADFDTWTLVHAEAGYVSGYDQATGNSFPNNSVQYDGGIIIPINPSGGAPTATEVLHYDGSAWSKVEVDAAARLATAACAYTDGVAATPYVWLVADDDLFSYTTAGGWAAEDTGAFPAGYRCMAGPLNPPASTATWTGPSVGQRVAATQTLAFSATGGDYGVVIKEDGADVTSSWTLTHWKDPATHKFHVEAVRKTAPSNKMVKYDVYVEDVASNYFVKRFMFIGPDTATAATTIKTGHSVIHRSDQRQYYVQKTRVDSDATRYAFLRGSGAYADTWVDTEYLEHAPVSKNLKGIEYTVGTPGASP